MTEQPSLFDPVAEGRALAEEGAALALNAQDDPQVVWRKRADEVMQGLLQVSRVMHDLPAQLNTFTADDITKLAGEPPHPNAMGGLFRAYRSQLIPVGYTESTRPAAHARVIRVWKAKR